MFGSSPWIVVFDLVAVQLYRTQASHQTNHDRAGICCKRGSSNPCHSGVPLSRSSVTSSRVIGHMSSTLPRPADCQKHPECLEPCQESPDPPTSTQSHVALDRRLVNLWRSHFRPVSWPFCRVEVKGLEPSSSALRKSGSRRFDQVLCEDFPGGSVSIPSGSLTIPLRPSR